MLAVHRAPVLCLYTPLWAVLAVNACRQCGSRIGACMLAYTYRTCKVRTALNVVLVINILYLSIPIRSCTIDGYVHTTLHRIRGADKEEEASVKLQHSTLRTHLPANPWKYSSDSITRTSITRNLDDSDVQRRGQTGPAPYKLDSIIRNLDCSDSKRMGQTCPPSQNKR